jgi:glycosyltransferase involved in cell wall biosynthesis
VASHRVRIGVVTTSYPRFPGDAAGSFVAAHVAWLRARGHDVDVVGADHGVAAPPGIFYGGGAPDAIEAGASKRALARFTLDLAVEVRRRARGWDATVAHWWVPSAAVAAAAGAPRLLAIAHGGDVHVARRVKLLGPVAALLIARGAKLVFVSRALRDAAMASLPAPIARRADAIVQPMGIDLARFASIRAARPSLATKTVAVLARLVPIKGVAVAIDAMRALATTGVRLVIAGDGPLRAELETRARGLPIDFLGAPSRPAPATSSCAPPRSSRSRRSRSAAAPRARPSSRARRSPPACRSSPARPAGSPICRAWRWSRPAIRAPSPRRSIMRSPIRDLPIPRPPARSTGRRSGLRSMLTGRVEFSTARIECCTCLAGCCRIRYAPRFDHRARLRAYA